MGGRRDEKISGPKSVDWFCFDASGRSHAGQSRCGVFGRTQSHLLKTSDPHIVWRMDSFIDVVFVHTYKLVVAHLPQRHPPPLFPRFCLKLLQIRPDKFQIYKIFFIFNFTNLQDVPMQVLASISIRAFHVRTVLPYCPAMKTGHWTGVNTWLDGTWTLF